MFNVEINESISQYSIILRQFQGVNFFKYQCSNELLKRLMSLDGFHTEDNASFYFEICIKHEFNIINILNGKAKEDFKHKISKAKKHIEEIEKLLVASITPFQGVFKCAVCGFTEYYDKSLYSSSSGLTCCAKCNTTYNLDCYSLDYQKKIFELNQPQSSIIKK